MRRLYSYLKSKYSNYKFHLNLKKKLHEKEIIVIHQMGKVGSSSVYNSLKSLRNDFAIFHTHFLNPERLQTHLTKIQQQGRKPENHLIESKALREAISGNFGDKNWKIITLVREPISRNISAFFQNIETQFPDFVSRYRYGSLKIEEIIDVFLASYPHELPLYWLQQEIEAVFGVDVFAVDFPKADGYVILRRDHEEHQVKLLLIRLEDLTDCSAKAFSDFLGLREFTLKRTNEGIGKQYSDAYKEFIKSINFPRDYVEKMYKSRYVQHFYSEHEIEQFRTKWLKQN
jgi:hypothetical protein